MVWDGKNRRVNKEVNTHDLLIRIDSNLLNLISDFNEHKKLDLEMFNKINTSLSGDGNGNAGLRTRLDRLEQKENQKVIQHNILWGATATTFVTTVVKGFWDFIHK